MFGMLQQPLSEPSNATFNLAMISNDIPEYAKPQSIYELING